MNQQCNVQIITDKVGGEATIAAMDDYSRLNIGRKTYEFVRRVMRNPEYRAMVEARIAQKRAAGGQGGI